MTYNKTASGSETKDNQYNKPKPRQQRRIMYNKGNRTHKNQTQI